MLRVQMQALGSPGVAPLSPARKRPAGPEAGGNGGGSMRERLDRDLAEQQLRDELSRCSSTFPVAFVYHEHPEPSTDMPAGCMQVPQEMYP